MHTSRRQSLLTVALSLVLALSFVLYVTAGVAAAQTEPDFGEPPDVLIQGDDGDGIGRQIGEPVVTRSGGAIDTTSVLIVGGAGVILLILAGVTFAPSRRGAGRHVPDPTADGLAAARSAIQSTRTMQQLTEQIAVQGHELTGGKGIFVTVDGVEAQAGDPVDVASELVVRVNREQSLAKHQDMSAVPVLHGRTVVGLIAVEHGNAAALTALGQFSTTAYASAAAKQARSGVDSGNDVDDLTGIGNRRRFDADLANVADGSDDEAAPVSLAMFDVDNFHYYNEAHGKAAGNEVLRSIAELIAANLRETDVVYRFSGVQFVALLPAASVDNAFVVVERIRLAVESTDFDGEEVQPSGRVTLSIGIAEAPAHESGDLVSAADHALSQAKESGRNRVVIEADIR